MSGRRWREALNWSKKARTRLNLTVLVLLGLSSLLGLADLLGYFEHPDRRAVLDWVLTSDAGMAIEESAAQAFMARFPPPPDARLPEITHLTKQPVRSQGGPVMMASINYMHADESRTTYIATLAEVREWAAESRVPWFAWALTFFGFLAALFSFLIERAEAQAS